MKYTLTISTDDPQELIGLLSGNSGEIAAVTAPVKTKAGNTKKTSPPVKEENIDDDDDLLGGDDNSNEETLTLADVQAKVAALAQAGKRDAVKKVLAKHGATKTSDLDEEKFTAFVADLGKIK